MKAIEIHCRLLCSVVGLCRSWRQSAVTVIVAAVDAAAILYLMKRLNLIKLTLIRNRCRWFNINVFSTIGQLIKFFYEKDLAIDQWHYFTFELNNLFSSWVKKIFFKQAHLWDGCGDCCWAVMGGRGFLLLLLLPGLLKRDVCDCCMPGGGEEGMPGPPAGERTGGIGCIIWFWLSRKWPWASREGWGRLPEWCECPIKEGEGGEGVRWRFIPPPGVVDCIGGVGVGVGSWCRGDCEVSGWGDEEGETWWCGWWSMACEGGAEDDMPLSMSCWCCEGRSPVRPGDDWLCCMYFKTFFVVC